MRFFSCIFYVMVLWFSLDFLSFFFWLITLFFPVLWIGTEEGYDFSANGVRYDSKIAICTVHVQKSE